MGKALAPLRDEGVLIIGSSNATHNLRMLSRENDPIVQWASNFDTWLKEALLGGRYNEVNNYMEKAPNARMTQPWLDHFYPLHVVLGAAGERAKADLQDALSRFQVAVSASIANQHLHRHVHNLLLCSLPVRRTRRIICKGMAVARDIQGKKNRVVAIINNWTTMASRIYEAMSNAGYLDSNMIVILNDSRHSLHPKLDDGSKMAISPLSSSLSKLQSSRSFRRFREAAKGITKRIGKVVHELAAKVDEYARGMIGPPGATLFEELGL